MFILMILKRERYLFLKSRNKKKNLSEYFKNFE